MFSSILFIKTVTVSAENPLFVAVPDGAQPGIWKVEDLNGDGDALDDKEVTPYVSKFGFADLAVDANGIVYAIDGKTGTIFCIPKPEEIEVFRGGKEELGLTLQRPLSIAVHNHIDPNTKKSSTVLYIMDLALQIAARVKDVDGDGKAQKASEICVVLESSTTAPFTANRAIIDEVGRIVACNPNNQSVVRLDDANGDCRIEEPEKSKCPSITCGPESFLEFQVIREFISSQKINLDDPFGVAVSSTEEYFVSEFENRRFRVTRLTDINGDADALDEDEAIIYYRNTEVLRGYDIAIDDKDVLYVGEESLKEEKEEKEEEFVITRLADRNVNGVIDSGEATLFADFTKIGRPQGIATFRKPKQQLTIKHNINDVSPMRGPVLVVEGDDSTSITLLITESNTGTPVPDVKVVIQVLTGCFSVCPKTPRTESGGEITFIVTRTSNSSEDGETLKFSVNGDQLIVPVVPTPCTPAPRADPGADRIAGITEVVTLDGNNSVGEGLSYCWEQTDGTNVGLPECTEETAINSAVTFKTPPTSEALTFVLNVRNSCDMIDSQKVTVKVTDDSKEPTPKPTETSKETPTPTQGTRPTATPEPTPIQTFTPRPRPTETPKSTPTPVFTPRPTSIPTATPNGSPRPTATPTTKSFTFACDNNLEIVRGGIEKLTLNLGERVSCQAKLTRLRPNTVVEISTRLRPRLMSAVKVEPKRAIADEKGEVSFTLTAVKEGINWIAWAVKNDRDEFSFNKEAYDEGNAWGMYVEVEDNN